MASFLHLSVSKLYPYVPLCYYSPSVLRTSPNKNLTISSFVFSIITLSQLAPGQTIPLNLHAVDELGHLTVTLAFVSEADNYTKKLQLQHPFYLLWPNRSTTVPFSFNVPEKLYNRMQHKIGKDKRKIQIMDLSSSLENEAFFELELQTCRPGFQYSPESKVCECLEQDGILR